MKRVTRDIDLGDARDLLERVPRACLAVVTEHGPQVQSVVLVARDNRYFVGIGGQVEPQPSPDQEVVLLVDEGVHYFHLRAIYVLGHAKRADAPKGASAGQVWFEVVPIRPVAWGFGSMREVDDAS